MWIIEDHNLGVLNSNRMFRKVKFEDYIDNINKHIKDDDFNYTQILSYLENFLITDELLIDFDITLVKSIVKTNYIIILDQIQKMHKSNNDDLYEVVMQIKDFLDKIDSNWVGFINKETRNRYFGSIYSKIKDLKSRKREYKYKPIAYKSDLDRIVFSSSLRRMQDKTQVFPLEKYDYVRTRLTHSYEVSLIAELLGEQVKFAAKTRQIKPIIDSKIDEILKCASLLHDVGNPPFGHYGENVIREYFRQKWDELEVRDYSVDEHGSKKEKCNGDYKCIKLSVLFNEDEDHLSQMKNDFLLFDGNAQSLRVATKLQHYNNDYGLDLTSAVIGTMIKYPFESTNEYKKGKFGYFYSETDVIEELESLGTFRYNIRNPLSLLLEAADDISYITSDFDDAVKKGAITYENINSVFIKNKNHKDEVIKVFINDFYKYYERNSEESKIDSLELTVRRMTNDLKGKLISSCVQTFIDQYYYIKKGINYEDKDKNKFYELLDKTDFSNLVSFLKNHLFKKFLYSYSPIIKNELEGRQILTSLLDLFTKALLNMNLNDNDFSDISHEYLSPHKKIFSLISPNFFDAYLKAVNLVEKDDPEYNVKIVYYRLKLVTDYISGMTDSYAKEMYNTLNGIII